MCVINCSGSCPECSPEEFTKEEIIEHFVKEYKKLEKDVKDIGGRLEG